LNKMIFFGELAHKRHDPQGKPWNRAAQGGGVFALVRNKLQARRKPPEPTSRERLIEDMRDVRRQLEAVQSYFALESDEDLLDAAIYQREALHARYRYLLRLAKQANLTAPELPVIPENKQRQIN